jgi:tetratricopeptide (TPR) repeat protein
MRELQWYLETFLDYPFPPDTDRAERVLQALRDWGQQTFRSLFEDRSAQRMFDAATTDYSSLHLQISSDDPGVMAWPWEALRDPELGVLAHSCQIERRLNTIRDPQALPDSLPTDRVNILLVVARPYGKRDVRFRSIARPLVELIENQNLPARVDLLRPPTFERLREHLHARPGFYHILHFDGHGSYSEETPGRGGYTFQGPQGKLVFETDDGQPHPIAAGELSVLLRECTVPGVVLNACQSGMVGGNGGDPFASVATALLRSGMRDVVAMAYSLYVSGAQQFLPAFYRRLFEEGDMAAAVRAGRNQMQLHSGRVCARGEFPLQDWLLPVLYRQDPLSLSFAKEARKDSLPRASKLPEELRREKDPYGFVGRDSAILEMERAMRRAPAGILIQGLGGVGKTTLARGFLQWLDKTGGLSEGCFWLSFQEIRTAEYVFNRLGEALLGGNFTTLAMEKKVKALASVFHEHRYLIVWDNFESAAGIAGTSVGANLPDSDRGLLGQFLDELRGGASKVIITSRSPEDWLGPQRRFLLPLGGLDQEERWEYCNAILRDLGKSVNRNDPDLVGLMDLLGGHPLAMRAVLPQLEKSSAGEVLEAVRSNLASLKLDGDQDRAKLYATLAFVERSLPQELVPLLALIGMHEGFVNADYLEAMAKQVDAGWTRAKINTLMQALVAAGLLRDVGQATYEMHPLLTSYLRFSHLKTARTDNRDGWARPFVDVMARLAGTLASRQIHGQQGPFHVHGQNFHYALAEAERLGMSTEVLALMWSLAAFAQNRRNFTEAARLFERLVVAEKSSRNEEREAGAYHQLGRIAEEQRDFRVADQCYRKSLAIAEPLGNELGAAITYHQLGIIAAKQRDFRAAEQWYVKSLAIAERLGDEHGAANTYHQLGMIAEEQRDFRAAEQWYGKSLAIKERLGDEYGAAITYHHLGRIAAEQRDFRAAEQWYVKSLAITERLSNEHVASGTYHQLGMIAAEQRDFCAAEQWYVKSLAITERLGNEHVAAITYHHLGIIAEEQRDFRAAEQWYHKSLAIAERLGNEHGAAITYGQLGILAGLQEHYLESGQWSIKSLIAFLHAQDSRRAAQAGEIFMITYSKAAPEDREKLKAMWQEAGLGKFPPQDP